MGIAFLLVGVGFAVIAWSYRRPLYFATLTALGRNQYATVGQVLKAPFHQRGRNIAPAEVEKQMRVVQEDSNGYQLWETPIGKLWTPVAMTTLSHMVAETIYRHYGVGDQAVQRGDTVIDGGANVGVFVRDALNRGAKKVVAFEPADHNLECLRRNFSSEIAESKVVLVPKGLWHEPTVVRFSVSISGDESTNKILAEGEEAPTDHQLVSIPVTTIDEVRRELNLGKIDYIKLDIEGAERHALDGARETLRIDKPRLGICTYHLDDDLEVLPSKVLKTNPAYRIESGMCLSAGSRWNLRPHILFFL